MSILKKITSCRCCCHLSTRNLTPSWGGPEAASFSEDIRVWYMWQLSYYLYHDCAM